MNGTAIAFEPYKPPEPEPIDFQPAVAVAPPPPPPPPPPEPEAEPLPPEEQKAIKSSAATFRFNNPGAMFPGSIAKRRGGVAGMTGAGFPIARFPNPESGGAAMFDLLRKNYSGLSLARAIDKWSGSHDADAYTKFISKETGLDPDTVLGPDVLENPQLAIPMARAMSKWESGSRQTPLNDEQWKTAYQTSVGGAGPAEGPQIRERIAAIPLGSMGAGKPQAIAPAPAETQAYPKAQPAAGEVRPVLGPVGIDFQPLAPAAAAPAQVPPEVAAAFGVEGLDFPAATPTLLRDPNAPGLEGPFPRATPVVPTELGTGFPFAALPAVTPTTGIDFQPVSIGTALTEEQEIARFGAPLTPEQREARLTDVGFGPGVTPPFPEGAPQAQEILKARPLYTTEIPAETARGPTLEETVTGSIPEFQPTEIKVPRRGPPTTAPEAYQEAGGGLEGVFNAVDFTLKQPIITEDQASQLVSVVAGGARLVSRAVGNADVEQGAEESISQTLSGFTTPEGIAQLVLLKNPVARAVFAGETLAQIPADIAEVSRAYQAGDRRGLGSALATTMTNLFMGATMAREPLKGRPAGAKLRNELGTIQGEINSLARRLEQAKGTPAEGEIVQQLNKLSERAQALHASMEPAVKATSPAAGEPAPPAEAPPAKPTVPAGEAAPTPGEPIVSPAVRGGKRPTTPAVPFMEDPGIPHMVKIRMADELKAAGYSQEAIKSFSVQEHAAKLAEARTRRGETPDTEGLTQAEAAQISALQERLNRGAITEAQYQVEARKVLGKPAEEPTRPVVEEAEPTALVRGEAIPLRIQARLDAAPGLVKRIEGIVARGRARMNKAQDPAIRAQRPSEYDWLTADEIARVERLKAKLPTAGEEALAAKARVKAKRAERAAAETAEETRARLEYEREQEEALGRAGSEDGPELLEAIMASGGLPAAGGKARAAWKGELAALEDLVRTARKAGQKIPMRKLFNQKAHDVDRLVTSLRDHGFEIERPQDLFPILEERFRSGKTKYGKPPTAPTGEVFGFGPGAASAGEPLAVYEKRAFAERLQQDKGIAAVVRENLGNRYYEPVSNKLTAAQAVEKVDSMPIDQGINNVLRNESLDYHVKSAMGQLIMKRLNKAHETLTKAGDHAAAEKVLEQTVDMSDYMVELGTRGGQLVQSFAMWQRLTPEGMLLSVSRKVKKARQDYTDAHAAEIAELKAEIDRLNQIQITDAERVKELKKLFGKNPTARKVKPYLEKLLKAARTGKMQDQLFYEIVAERLGLPAFDRNVSAEITRLAFAIEKAPEGLPKDKLTLQLNHYIATRMGFKASDLPLGVWYGNMLSGYNTQIVNFVDTLINVQSEIFGMAITNPRSAAKIYGQMLKGMREGPAEAALIMKLGRVRGQAAKYLETPALMEVAQFGTKGGVPTLGKGRTGRFMKRVAEAGPARVLNAWKQVSRVMMASDAVMYRMARNARAALYADQAARGEGLRGKKLHRRVREMMGETTEAYREFREQAKAEGFTGVEARARVTELKDQAQRAGEWYPEEGPRTPEDWAGMATYNHEPQGLFGAAANGLSQASTKFPPLKLVVPFTRIVANVTNRGLNYTPYGFVRAYRGYHFDKALPTYDASIAHLTRASMGTIALGTLGSLQSSGYVEIHGAGPKDAEKRRQLMAAGWKPYSVQIGDRYLSYLPTPLALGLGAMGNWIDAGRYGEMDNKDALTATTYVLARSLNVISSQSFLSGMSNMFSALSNNPDQAVAAWRNYVAQLGGSFISPRIVTDLDRLYDSTKFGSDNIAQDLLRNTPFAKLITKPALNAFGEATELPKQRFISTVSKDLAWKIVLDKNLRVPMPGKHTEVPDGRGGTRQLTPDEYYNYLKETGPAIKEWIIGRAWQYEDPIKAQEELERAAREIREPVMERIKKEAQFNPVD
jgi:hypothetical protein